MLPYNNIYIHTPTEAKKIIATELDNLKKISLPPGYHKTLRFEIPVEPQNLLLWLYAQNWETKFYFSSRNPDDTESTGIGIADIIEDHENLSYEPLFAHIRTYLSTETPNLRYYGGFAFNPDHIDSDWKSFGTTKFFIPRFELFIKNNTTFLACNIILENNSTTSIIPTEPIDVILSELEQLNFEYKNIDIHNMVLGEKIPNCPKWHSRMDFPAFDTWEKNITQAVSEIRKKIYMKTVLARKVVLDFDKNLEPELLLLSLKKLLQAKRYDFLFQFQKNTAFIGSSPERLYKRTGKTIESEAVAGTRTRGKIEQDDLRLANELLDSDKEQREHNFVVDTIEDVLHDLCSSLDIDEQKSLLKLREGQHLVSHFKGILKDDVTDPMLLSVLHPTPAVGGCPLDKALDAIKCFEPFKRGWYAGVIGTVGYDSSDFAVGLRSALINENRLSLFSGVGIVDGSNPSDEWREVETKIGNFLSIIGSDEK